MDNNQKVCPYCAFDQNATTATVCERCQTPLESVFSKVNRSKTFTADSTKYAELARRHSTFVIALSLIVFLTMAVISIFNWRAQILRRNISTKQLVKNNEVNNDSESQSIQSSGSQSNQIDDFNPKSDNTFIATDRVPQGTFWYGSSIPFSPLHTPEITESINRALPKFKTVYKEPPAYTKPGSSTSVAMLLDGMVSFAELSRPLKDSEYQKATVRGFTLQQIPIASDGIVFFVHPALAVDKLTIEQVRKMILGEITNWQEVGGPDLPVVPFVFDPKIAPSTLLLLFKEPELEQFSSKAQYVRDYTDAIRKVSATPGGISYASAAIITNQRSVNPLSLARGNSQNYVNPFTQGRMINTEALQNGDYPLLRRFFIGIRRDGTIDERVGSAYADIWLSQSGQKLIEKAGFVPIKSF